MSEKRQERSELSSLRNDDALPLQQKNTSADGKNEEETPKDHPTKSIGLGQATLLILSGTTGTGVIAMPYAFKQAGWTCVALLAVLTLACTYSGVLLGRSWMILVERYPELTHDVRRPYALIAQKAVGNWMGHVVVACVIITDMGFPIVLVLLISQNLESLLGSVGVHVSMCYWLLIICVILVPVSLLDTPKDFWWMGIFGASTTAIAFICVITSQLTEMTEGKRGVLETNPSGKAVLLAMGNCLYSLGGGPVFPTIQHDMKKPADFSRAVSYSYIVTWVMYTSVSSFGYVVYGVDLKENVLQNMPEGTTRVVAETSITIHSFFALIILMNPFVQAVEGIAGIQESFSWKKALLRISCVALIIFIAETVPRFGSILDLIGISTLGFLSVTAPALFYMCLCSQKGDWTDRSLPLHSKVLCIEIIVMGILLGVFGTYSALDNLISSQASTFVPPCYIRDPT